MQQDLESLSLEYKKCSEILVEELQNVQKITSSGCVPTEEVMDKINSIVKNLQNQYDIIFNVAVSEVPQDQIPQKGIAVDALFDLLQKNRNNELRTKFEDAKNCLKLFINVTSESETYLKVLRPYQKEVSDVLSKLGDFDNEKADKFIESAVGPKLFIRVLNADVESDEGVVLLEEVTKYYPKRVQLGLAGERYYIVKSDAKSENKSNNREKNDNKENEENKAIEVNSGTKKEDIEEPFNKDENIDESDIFVDKGKDINEKKEVIENTEETKDANVLVAVNKIKTSVPGASSFRKDITKLSRTSPEVRIILPLLSNLGVLTEKQIYLFGVCLSVYPEDDKNQSKIEKGTETLASKGYIAAYECERKGSIEKAYCLTYYTYGSLHKESNISQMKDFWHVSLGDNTIYGKEEIEKQIVEKTIERNEKLLSYCHEIKDHTDEEKYKHIISTIKPYDDHNEVEVVYGDTSYNCYVIDENSDGSKIESENILIVDSEENIQGVINDKVVNVFVLKNGVIDLSNTKPENVEEDSEPIEELQEEISNQILADNVDSKTVEKNNVITEKSENRDESIREEVNSKKTNDKESNSEKSSNNERSSDKKSNEVAGSESISDVTTCDQTTKDKTTAAETVKTKKEREVLKTEPEVLEPQDLVNLKRTPTDDEFCSTTLYLLKKATPTKEGLASAVANALLLINGASFVKGYDKCKKLANQLSLATDIPMGEATYTSVCLSSIFDNPETDDKVLLLSAYLFAMLKPALAHDYELKNQAERYFQNYDNIFKNLYDFKALFNVVKNVGETVPNGFTTSVLALLGSDAENEAYLNDLQRQAKENLTYAQPKTRIKDLKSMYMACFGIGSELYECMSIISENKKSEIDCVEMILNEYCDSKSGALVLNDDKIEEKLAAEWDTANSKTKFKLEYDAHDKAIRQYKNRLEIMLTWTEHINSTEHNRQAISKMKTLREEIYRKIDEIQLKTEWRKDSKTNVLSWMLYRMRAYLSGKGGMIDVFSGLLNTGIISMQDNGMPYVDPDLQSVEYYEPWRNALRHIVANKKSFSEVKAEILNEDLGDETGLVDNLHQLEMIGRVIGNTSDEYQISSEQLSDAIASAEKIRKRFDERLELAYTYNQINETNKESIVGALDDYKEKFYKIEDFACWRRFIDALGNQVDDLAKNQKAKLRISLDNAFKKSPDSRLLKEAEKLLEDKQNFAVAEEYLNRFESGDTEFIENFDLSISEKDYFKEFLAKGMYDLLLQECRLHNGTALKIFGEKFLLNHFPSDWTSRLKEDSKNLILNWLSRRYQASCAQMQSLFRSFGLDVIKVEKSKITKEEVFNLTIKPTERSMADYPHPISALGTQVKSPVSVIILYGNYTEKQLVDTVSSLDQRGISFVLLDRPLEQSQRRMIGEIFHTQTSRQNPFLLIDQVLALYLALHQNTERMRALLKCTLPYTTYQPFRWDGGSTADEMFYGRTKELSSIIDPNV
jgi:hypothetical protein